MPALQYGLQAREIGISIGVGRDDLAVDQAWRKIERGEMADERRELLAPVQPAPGVYAHVLAFGGNQRAIAVELNLVHPLIAAWNLVDQRGELHGLKFG